MMKAGTIQRRKWLSLIVAVLLSGLPCCTSVRGPTPAEFPQIVSAVRQNLSAEHGALPDWAPVEIRIRNRTATVKYAAQYETG